ncbi:vacuolar import/degradation protein Vid24, partial [Scheffersomyces amazonensis]|uniref:vacuolar import/degradation protein Vid24 n=1 Tax=Scheffersomyces amazonensis TaxID=1078765 RepID=UPI00315D4A4B
YLRPNAQYIGEQQSGKSRFHIKVEFKTVDLINSIVTGFLQISGLTENHSEIITCFKDHNNHNEQIIRKYSFITENKQWGSYIKNDFEHWKKLSNMSDLSDEELQQRLIRIQNGEEDNEFIYMRWKEEFLLPDSRVKQISGASFDGFYYIVLNIGQTSSIGENNPNMIPGSISGLYYHKSSEKFQSLSLRYVDDRGISGSFEFV